METWVAIIIGMLIVIVGVPALILLVVLIVGLSCNIVKKKKFDAAGKNAVDCLAYLKLQGYKIEVEQYGGEGERYVISRKRNENDK